MTQTTQNPIKRRLNEMLEVWFSQQKFTVLANQKVLDVSGRNAPIDDLFRSFSQDTLDQAGVGITKESKKDAFILFINEKAAQAALVFSAAIAYNPNSVIAGFAELDRWLHSVLGRTPNKLETACMKHFLWQICRKNSNLKVIDHMMPIFTGQQGNGKSQAIKRLLEPISGLTISGQPLTYITDPNNYKALGQNLCIFTDEMARCNVVDIDRLKFAISGEDLNYRIFHTQSNGYADQRCTLIGASNKEFREVIQDPTGIRRFFPFRCAPTTDLQELKVRWAVMNSINAKIIWQAINEHQDTTYIEECYAEVRAFQENLRMPGSIEEWLEDHDLQPGEQRISLADLYRSYKEHSIDSSRKDIFNKRGFKLTLQDRGFAEQKYANGNVNYMCNKKSIKEPFAIKQGPITTEAVIKNVQNN